MSYQILMINLTKKKKKKLKQIRKNKINPTTTH